MALVIWIKDNLQTPYGSSPWKLKRSRKRGCTCQWGDAYGGGNMRTDAGPCKVHDRPLTQGEAINRAPDLRVAYEPAKLAGLPYVR